MRATVGLYAPNLPGYTRATMAWTMGCDAERRSESSKPGLSSDRGLQLTLVTPESLVIGVQHAPVNTSLFLVHTARQVTRVGSR